MHFSLILAGMLFLFSPDISIIDILPDSIGWLLIVLGLSRLSDIEERAEDARAAAKRMIFISAAKGVISLFMLRFSSADLLLAAFSFAVVELICVIPFSKNMFTALDYTAMRVGAPLDSDKLNLSRYCLTAFFIIKNALAVIPPSVSLFDSEMTGEYSSDTWFVDFDALMRTLIVAAFFVSIVTAVVMTVYFVPFWRKMARSRELNGKLLECRKKTVLDVPTRMAAKQSSFVISLIVPAVVFFFDFYLDGVEILPTFIGFALIFTASLYAQKRMSLRCMALTVLSALGFVISLTAYLYKLIPLIKNKFVIDLAFSSQPLTLPMAAVNAIITAAVFVFLYRFASLLNERYTKYHLEDSIVLYILGGAVLAAFDLLLYTYPEYNTTFVFPSLIFGTAFCALGAYYFIKLLRQIKFDNKD